MLIYYKLKKLYLTKLKIIKLVERLVTVSVIVPNYNHAAFLEQRIESILNQSFRDFEVILLDDCSTDNSTEVLEKYRSHPNVSHLFFNTENSGTPFGLWQKGLSLAQGKFIWIAESDDWCEPNFLEIMVPKMENSNAVMAHCKSFNVAGGIHQLNPWWDDFGTSFWKLDYVKNGKELLEYYGKYKCPVMNVSSAIMDKEHLVSAIIPVGYRYCGDWWFWTQLFMKGEIAFCATPLNYIRVHKASAIRKRSNNPLRRLKENVTVIRRIHTLLDQPFRYSIHYDWLIQLYVDEMFKNGRYFNLKFLFPKLPFTFRRKIWKLYLNRLWSLVTLKLKKSNS